jgi:nucleoside phosphorylase
METSICNLVTERLQSNKANFDNLIEDQKRAIKRQEELILGCMLGTENSNWNQRQQFTYLAQLKATLVEMESFHAQCYPAPAKKKKC